MFDFNFFKRDYSRMHTQESIAPVEVPAYDEGPVYQVGKTIDGSITLRIGFTTLTMTDDAVDTLIRMLEAAKGTNDEES
jgi:hypothetical protein